MDEKEELANLYRIGFPRGEESFILQPMGQIWLWRSTANRLQQGYPAYWENFSGPSQGMSDLIDLSWSSTTSSSHLTRPFKSQGRGDSELHGRSTPSPIPARSSASNGTSMALRLRCSCRPHMPSMRPVPPSSVSSSNHIAKVKSTRPHGAKAPTQFSVRESIRLPSTWGHASRRMRLRLPLHRWMRTLGRQWSAAIS